MFVLFHPTSRAIHPQLGDNPRPRRLESMVMKSEDRSFGHLGGWRILAQLRSLIGMWLLSLLGCGVISFAFAWQMSDSLSLSALDVFRIVGRDWLIWSFAIPVIFAFVQRFPVERSRWKFALPIHAVAYVLLLLAIGWLGQSFRFKDERHRAELKPGKQVTEGKQNSDRLQKPPRPLLGQLIFGPHLPIYLAVLGIAHAFYFYRRGKEREMRAVELSARLAEARLQALRMQIQPHFFFNSLNALGALIQKDTRAADDMLVAISDFLRVTIDGSTEQEVPLCRELEYIEYYLAIEKARLGDRLNYVITPDLDTIAAHLPALLLQPLVENAVRHGIEPNQRAGVITIRSWQDGKMLHVMVEDNGVGIITTRPEGIGLSNIKSRLRELYRDEASLTLRSESGTQVEICVPLQFV
jgi:two-component system, LytTR family, sensor kinase